VLRLLLTRLCYKISAESDVESIPKIDHHVTPFVKVTGKGRPLSHSDKMSHFGEVGLHVHIIIIIGVTFHVTVVM